MTWLIRTRLAAVGCAVLAVAASIVLSFSLAFVVMYERREYSVGNLIAVVASFTVPPVLAVVLVGVTASPQLKRLAVAVGATLASVFWIALLARSVF